MRVLVLAEAIGDLGAGTAGAAAARAWATRGHQVALVPLASAGGDLAGAVADLLGTDSGVVVVADPGSGGSSGAWGERLVTALVGEPDQVWLDLASTAANDLGAGLLQALAGSPATVDEALVRAARARLGSTRLVGIAPLDQVRAELTGLRGVASLAAAAARDAGQPVPPVADLLEFDARLTTMAASLGVSAPPPGAGAAAGLGLPVLALGGAIASACGALGELAGLGRTVERADLLVVVADALDFGTAGGEVVTAARAEAEAAAVPCVAVCRSVRISVRELRTLGIEAAYGLEASQPVTSAALGALADRVAATWSWSDGNLAGGAGVYPHVH